EAMGGDRVHRGASRPKTSPACARGAPSYSPGLRDTLAQRMKADASDDGSLIGRVIQERFRIIDRIAAGGMGAVYLAEQLPLGRKVALKVLEPAGDNYSAKAQFQERFFLE